MTDYEYGGELDDASVIRKFRITASDGKMRQMVRYKNDRVLLGESIDTEE